MEFNTMQACTTLPNPGELVEQWPEFQESEEAEPAEVVRELSETCVEREECSPLSRHGEDGTGKSTSNKEDTPLLPLLPPVGALL